MAETCLVLRGAQDLPDPVQEGHVLVFPRPMTTCPRLHFSDGQKSLKVRLLQLLFYLLYYVLEELFSIRIPATCARAWPCYRSTLLPLCGRPYCQHIHQTERAGGRAEEGATPPLRCVALLASPRVSQRVLPRHRVHEEHAAPVHGLHAPSLRKSLIVQLLILKVKVSFPAPE